MRRLLALVFLGATALLLTPGAASAPDVPGDPTPPVVTPVISGTLGNNSWYRSDVTVSWSVTDPESIILETNGCDTKTLTAETAGTTLTCSATSDGGTTTVNKTFKIDKTNPLVTSKTPSRPPDKADWYNHLLTVTFAGSDNLSGIDTCSKPDYSGPDSATASVSGTCTDMAGNQSPSSSFSIKYDGTKPQVTGKTPSRPPDKADWYNHLLTVTFAGSDNLSGIDTCSKPDFNGPDDLTASVSGTCTDKAGNTSNQSSFGFKYDGTKPQVTSKTPSRPPDKNGWYNHELTVTFAGSDNLSGIDSCNKPAYSTPDSATASVSGVCADLAGNTSNQSSFGFNYDGTQPQVTQKIPTPAPNANGWFNSALTVEYKGSDNLSGIDTCSKPDYSGPDSATASVSGSCTDEAGNQSPSSSFSIKYDETKPEVISKTPSRPPDKADWYNHELTVTFAGSDNLSGIDSCSKPDYGGPDKTDASVSGTCTDVAGNQSLSSSFGFQYDGTKPQVTTKTPSRPPDKNGWYNHELTVTFAGSDNLSGIDSCSKPAYSTPDSATASVSGVCTDLAGNTSNQSSFGFKYDETPPSNLGGSPARPPDAKGWYNHALTVNFTGNDNLAGIDSCSQPTYTQPDSATASVSGTCTDMAGNQSLSNSFGFKYDGTKPEVTDTIPSRPPNADGWYKDPLSVTYKGSDNLSAIASCAQPSYSGPESAAASVSGSCFDNAGNESPSSSFGFKYDATGPQVIPSPAREPDSNGWYNHSVAVGFAGSDGASGLASCVPVQNYEGPDSVFAVVTGTCTDKAGNVGLGSLALKYDSTAPQVSGATADRAPDANGWFNRPLSIRFFGSDATSDIDACSVVPYDGPNNPSATVSGSCRDRAGNWSGSNALAFKYDAVAPSLTKLTVKPGNRSAVLSWEASPDTSLVEVVRTTGMSGAGVSVYRGAGRGFTDSGLQNGVRYRYTATGYDEAGNASTQAATATPTAPLSPQAGATVSAPPRLTWRRDEKATYYNVQVWRRGRVFSAWPTGTSIKLTRTWTYNGRRHRLTPGRYRWYVWPGYGARAKKDFGRLIGSSSFIVRR
jgi:large repetitive protein